MTIKLVVTDSGRVLFTNDQPFPAEVQRVEFYADTKLVVLVCDTGEDDEGELLPTEVADELIPALESTATAMVAEVDDNDKYVEGFEVPIIRVGI